MGRKEAEMIRFQEEKIVREQRKSEEVLRRAGWNEAERTPKKIERME